MKRTLLTLFCTLLALAASADEGMWLPSLISERIDDMRAKGFRLTAEDIYSINKASMKDAVVLVHGGCTGELISPEGLLLTTSWDWNLNDQTREFGKKFFAKTKRMPTDIHAANYSATINYLKAVEAAGTMDADKVMAKLKSTPIDDFYGKGVIRPDGRFAHDMYLMQVKAPAESKEPWDYYKVLATLPAEQVWTTKAESKCALWK